MSFPQGIVINSGAGEGVMAGFRSTLAMQTSARRHRRPTGRPKRNDGMRWDNVRMYKRQAAAQARHARGKNVAITIRTWQNTPEYEWAQTIMRNAKRSGQVQSKALRRGLNKLLESESYSCTVDGLVETLKHKESELKWARAEIIHLRHALGEHFDRPHPDCEACKGVPE